MTREDPARLWLAWGDVTYRQSLVALRGADAPDGPAWRTPRDVAWVAGCAMWFRAEALRALGLLDEAFFAYHEEVDWCARAREAGWRVVYWPDAGRDPHRPREPRQSAIDPHPEILRGAEHDPLRAQARAAARLGEARGLPGGDAAVRSSPIAA